MSGAIVEPSIISTASQFFKTFCGHDSRKNLSFEFKTGEWNLRSSSIAIAGFSSHAVLKATINRCCTG